MTSNRIVHKSRPTSRMLRLERLESRQLLSVANGVDYNFNVVAKAAPDEWFTAIGATPVPITDAQPAGAIAKVNQDYVWGMTQSGNFLWYATSGNVLAQASGAIGGTGGQAFKNTIRVAEYGQSQYPGISDTLKPFLGDWRLPKLYKYDMVNKVNTPLEINDPLLNQTLGIRSAGANSTIVLFAGPDISYAGMNVFAFNAQTGAYIGSRHVLLYTDVRNWVNYNNQLYTGVSRTFSTAGEGSVLRWTGSLSNPFSFTEVGRIDSEVASLVVHNGRLYAGTWPLNYGSLMGVLGFRSDAVASLWMSPTLGTTGLTSYSTNSWKKVWSITSYDPDPVVAKSIGMGAIASYNGYLVWGTMQVPATASVVLGETYPNVDFSKVPSASDPTYGSSSGERAIAIFRGKDFDKSTGGTVELLYGDAKMWTYVPGANPSTDPGTWQLKSNTAGGQNGIYGRAGFGNPDNYYTWSMAVRNNPLTSKDELYIGTFDISPVIFGDAYTAFKGDEGLINTYGWVQAARPMNMGADLWVFDDMNGPAEAASLDGLGNPLNHGVRTMQSTPYGLFLGTANASNLLTAAYNPPGQPLKAGGAELVLLSIRPVAPIQLASVPVAEMSPAGTPVGTFSMSVPGTFSFSLLDNAGGRFQLVGDALVVAGSSLLNYETIYQPTITVQATDGTTTYQRTFTVYLTNVNEQPTNVRFSTGFTGVKENTLTGTVITRLSTTDPDAALDTYTYTLLDNAEGRFALSGRNVLVADGSLLDDFETHPNTSYSILVKSTDSGGLTVQKTLVIPLVNANEAPTDIALDNSSVNENSPVGTAVGNLSATDPDAGDTWTYTILDDAGGWFGIQGTQLVVANNSALDYETSTSHAVLVQAADAGGLTFQKTLTVTINNVNEAPTAVNLSGNRVKELSSTDTPVGTLSTVDPDVGDAHTYTLVNDAGGRFKLSGNQVLVGNGSLLHAGDSYNIVVRSTDTGLLLVDQTLTVTVTTANPLSSMVVQNGMKERSYVRYLDLVFENSNSLSSLISGNRIRLRRFDLNGGGTAASVSLTGKLSVNANKVHFDFGSAGIGGNASSSTGDGYYEIGLDLDGNGAYETIQHFYRLYGDVNGDRTVDNTDVSLVTAARGTTGTNLEADVNGDGRVNSTDSYAVSRAKGRKLAAGLPLDG